MTTKEAPAVILQSRRGLSFVGCPRLGRSRRMTRSRPRSRLAVLFQRPRLPRLRSGLSFGADPLFATWGGAYRLALPRAIVATSFPLHRVSCFEGEIQIARLIGHPSGARAAGRFGLPTTICIPYFRSPLIPGIVNGLAPHLVPVDPLFGTWGGA